MTKKLVAFVATCFVLALPVVTQADIVAPYANGFDSVKANARFSLLQGELKKGKLFDNQSYKSIQTVKDLKDKAGLCAKEGEAKLKKIDGLLKDESISGAIANNKQDYAYLRDERSRIAKKVAACKVFVFKVDQLLELYSESIQQHTNAKAIKIVEPIWSQVSKEIISQFSVSPKKIYQDSGVGEIKQSGYYSLIGVLFTALFLAGLVYNFSRKILLHQEEHKIVTNHFAVIIKRYVFLLLPIASVTAFLHSYFYSNDTLPVIAGIGYALSIYFSVIALADFILYLPTKRANQLLTSKDKNRIFWRYTLLATVLLFGYFGAVTLKGQEMSEGLVSVIRASYITLLLLSVLWLTWAACCLSFFIKKTHILLRGLTRYTISAIFLILIVSEWLGYGYISLFVLKGIVLTVFTMLLSWGVILLVERLFTVFEDQHYQAARALRKLTNLKWHHSFIEFYMLRMAAYLSMLGFFVLAIMKIWGANLFHIDLIRQAMIDGFPLLGAQIVPLNIVVALIVFSVIHLSGRIYATRIAWRYRGKQGGDSQVAVSSIINYISFFVAVIVGLLIAGVNFTGLAIIAGALSVGIGFGLQNIVNNFLCGLILLIHKPVKPGDRVVVGETEGFIRKIRVLSTQIKTLSKEDVIIPNSDLISNPVVNYMFRDSSWRVTCQVGVAYGSDTELVKKVLLEVAAKHPDVIQDEPNQPVVLFTSFGDSALLFELWCIIRDVNKKFRVLSDLNFQIDTAFRQHDIVIAFPQRDLHIKEMVKIESGEGSQPVD